MRLPLPVSPAICLAHLKRHSYCAQARQRTRTGQAWWISAIYTTYILEETGFGLKTWYEESFETYAGGQTNC